MKDYQKLVKKLLDSFMEKQLTLDKKTMLLLAEEWGSVSEGLAGQIKTLSQLAEKGTLTPNQLYQLTKYQDFLAESKVIISQYSEKAGGIIASAQAEAVTLGELQSKTVLGTIGVQLGNNLPKKAIETFIGSSTYDGAPLKAILVKDYPETVLKLTDTLLQGISQAKNPVTIARQMQADMGGNLDRALRISRTEVMNCYRESARQTMQEQGMVKQWGWIAEDDACEDCKANDGKRFPITQSMETHPNCRCGELPVIE